LRTFPGSRVDVVRACKIARFTVLILTTGALQDGFSRSSDWAGLLGRLKSVLVIRVASASDSRRIWEWRNDPASRSASGSTGEVSWAQHDDWFSKTLSSGQRILLIGESEGDSIGMCRFDVGDAHATVSINLNPAFRGRRLSKPLLEDSIREFWRLHPGIDLRALIRPDNRVSAALFRGVGFRRTSAEDALDVYAMSAGERPDLAD
jgi:L-amino acid N-acyltransferase YncA